MAQYNFGTGTMIAKRTDVSNTPPVIFGVCKNISIDFSRTIKELVGQSQVPVALGAGELKAGVKVDFARISFSEFNNLFFGQNGAAGTLQLTPSPGVSGTVPGSSTYTVTPTVPGSGTFVEDQGVYYSATGTQLTPIAAASEALGKYSVNNSTGVYTFAAADASASLLFFFTYTTSAAGYTVTLANQLMGAAPTFELSCQQEFTQYGTKKILNIQLLSCMSEKLMFPFKNTDFTDMTLDIKIQQNAAGNFAIISTTDP